MKTKPKHYALAGCSGRGLYMYAKPLVETYSARAQLVGLFDINQGRMDYINQFLNVNIPAFTDFDAMMRAVRPDIVIVATMNLVVHYSGGTQMSYSLNAHCVYEGWRLALNGTTGRLEAADWDSGPYFVKDKQDKQDILLHRWNGTVFNISTETIRVPIDTSGHFGGDVRIQKMLFDGPQPDPFGHTASSRAGAMSLLTGAAANRSIASGQPIRIGQLLLENDESPTTSPTRNACAGASLVGFMRA